MSKKKLFLAGSPLQQGSSPFGAYKKSDHYYFNPYCIKSYN